MGELDAHEPTYGLRLVLRSICGVGDRDPLFCAPTPDLPFPSFALSLEGGGALTHPLRAVVLCKIYISFFLTFAEFD